MGKRKVKPNNGVTFYLTMFLTVLVILTAFVGVQTFSSEGWGLSYVCSTDTDDVYRLETNHDTYWTLVPQVGNQQVTTNNSGRYVFPKGGVFVWMNMDALGLADVGEVECNGDNNAQPYTNPMNECLGFYAPVTEFIVDGVTYAAGSDGWVSFLVPRDAVWTWEVTVDGWTGRYQQTETEECHYVG